MDPGDCPSYFAMPLFMCCFRKLEGEILSRLCGNVYLFALPQSKCSCTNTDVEPLILRDDSKLNGRTANSTFRENKTRYFSRDRLEMFYSLTHSHLLSQTNALQINNKNRQQQQLQQATIIITIIIIILLCTEQKSEN